MDENDPPTPCTSGGNSDKNLDSDIQTVTPVTASLSTSPISQPAHGSSRKRARSAVCRDEDNALKVISAAMKQHVEGSKRNAEVAKVNEDEFDVFGKFVANELRAVPEQSARNNLKRQLCQVLFDPSWRRPTSYPTTAGVTGSGSVGKIMAPLQTTDSSNVQQFMHCAPSAS